MTTIKTFKNQANANDYCGRINRHRKMKDVLVTVDGPNDGEWTVMPIAEAIDAGFCYTFVTYRTADTWAKSAYQPLRFGRAL